MKDPDSYSYRGVKRRDFRQAKDGPEVIPARKSKKSKMCKRNKYGPHEIKSEIVDRYSSWDSCKVTCEHCGKDFSWSGRQLPADDVQWLSDDHRQRYADWLADETRHGWRVRTTLIQGVDTDDETG